MREGCRRLNLSEIHRSKSMRLSNRLKRGSAPTIAACLAISLSACGTFKSSTPIPPFPASLQDCVIRHGEPIELPKGGLPDGGYSPPEAAAQLFRLRQSEKAKARCIEDMGLEREGLIQGHE